MCAAALFGGLAAGALWCLVSLAFDADTALLILPFAVAIAAFLRWQGYAGWPGAACAVAATLLAFAYAQYLFVAVRIAQTLGLPLRSTLFKMDFGLGWQIARASIGTLGTAALVAACATAAVAMLWPFSKSRSPRR